MRIEDKTEFTKLLAASMAIYERQITSGFVDIFFSALSGYPLEVVREALNRHLQDPDGGRFAPKPADLIRQVVTAKASDGRPGKDEAWAIAQRSLDESETVVTSEEILEALSIARPFLEGRGDKVAARMAFIESYERIIAGKRSSGKAHEWIVSLGEDKSRRAPAIQSAKASGLLAGPRADHLIALHTEQAITADGLAIAGLLAGPEKLSTDQMRAKWKEIRSMVGREKSGKHIQAQEDLRRAEEELRVMAESKIDKPREDDL